MERDVRKVMAEHPDLPIIVIGEQVSYAEWNYCYLEKLKATTAHLLFPSDATLYGCCGLDDFKIYDDFDDVRDAIAEELYLGWEMYASKHRGGTTYLIDARDGGISISDMVETLAEAIAGEQPWREYVVIWASA